MKNSSKLLLLISLLFTGVFSATTYWIGIKHSEMLSSENSNNWSNIDIVLEHLANNYVDSLEIEKLSENSINNILKDLDPHSSYIPANQRQRLNESLVGHFGGIGIRFMIYNDTLTVVDVIDGGPSESVNINKRDRIITIDDENVAGINLTNEDVLKKLKGVVGSAVKLSILKPNKNIEIKNIIRGSIPLKSIPAFTMLKNEIGYIKISSFSNSTHIEFKKALNILIKKGMKSLILDLRFNGGGYLHQAINVADEFLKKNKLIVYTEGAHSKKRTFFSRSEGLFENGKLIILVNSSTASASEIVSGAIQDNDRGLILGRRTFGKGLVQQPLLLPDSSELRITTSRYYTPSGKCIQKPYGDTIDYDNDLFERIESGELTQIDSLKNNKFRGGILPNIYSPIDTSKYNDQVNEIIYTRKWRDFCFNYYEKYPISNFENVKEFYYNFKVQNNEVRKYLKKINKDIAVFDNNTINDLEWSLKIELSSYYYSDQSRYIISTFKDSDVKIALLELEK
ncbi:MAG: peptidase S41 [Crocinitomicaceae bacterium]|nr:peptidase S41 [Crocinitomicaceae bacterium]